jgi:Holliday junction DNA helicase RuvA
MYEFIRGRLVEATPHHAVIDVGGIGYKLNIPISAFGKIPFDVTLYTTFVVRENFQGLYGFLEKEERNLFEVLIALSGIGPKTALNLIGHLSLNDLQQAVLSENAKTLANVPGIGKKTAERLIIDLKEKVLKLPVSKVDLPSGHLHDAVNALIHLGYQATAAEAAIKKVIKAQPHESDLSVIIAAALKSRI